MSKQISENNKSGGHKANVKSGNSQAEDTRRSEELGEKCSSKIKQLRKTGQILRSDVGQPELSAKPGWFDETLFENAKSVYARHFMGVNFAHLSGLLLLVRVNSIYRTLSSTGRSDSVAKLFRRYYQTVVHVKKWYEGDIFEENSEANRSLSIVRGMHNSASSMLNDGRHTDGCPTREGSGGGNQTNNHDQNSKEAARAQGSSSLEIASGGTEAENIVTHRGVHISEYDIMITQFAFVGFIVIKPEQIGLIDDFSQHDLESMLHFWRVIGYYLGASEEYNLCSRELDDVRGLCKAIMAVEFKQSILKNPVSSPPGIMGINIVRSVKFIPMLTIYGITKYLYELLDLDTSEFEARATRYSRLSYTFIKLVMTNLLAYRPLRWFNNGLTRLSVFLVGKVEDWFARYLESKYGKELKF